MLSLHHNNQLIITIMGNISEMLNEKIVSEVNFSRDNYKLISFGTTSNMYVVEINGIRQKKVIKRLSKDLKELFNID